MSAQHGPTPWRFDGPSFGSVEVIDANNEQIGMFELSPDGPPVGVSVANAKRIIACVNACEPISHPADLTAGIAVLRAMAMGTVNGDQLTAILVLSTMGVGPPAPGEAVELPGWMHANLQELALTVAPIELLQTFLGHARHAGLLGDDDGGAE